MLFFFWNGRKLHVITEVSKPGYSARPLTSERVVFTTKAKLRFASIGCKESGGVIQSACQHAVLIV